MLVCSLGSVVGPNVPFASICFHLLPFGGLVISMHVVCHTHTVLHATWDGLGDQGSGASHGIVDGD